MKGLTLVRWSRAGGRGDRPLALAREFQAAGLYDDALALFLRAVEEAPCLCAAHEGLGWCRLARGEYVEAEDAFSRAASLDPEAPGPAKGIAAVGRWRYERFHEAWALFYQGRHAEALATFEAILVDPTLRLPAHEGWKILSGLGWCHYYLGDYQKAAGRFATILDLQKENPYALKGLGLCRYRLGDPAVAIPFLERAAAASDTAWECLSFVGWCRYALREWDAAAEAFRRASGLNPWAADPVYGIGWALLRKGDADAARESLAKAASLLPTHPSAPDLLREARRRPDWKSLLVALGTALHRTREYASARDVFRAALEAHPDACDVLFGLGLAQFRLGANREALDTLRRAIERGGGDLVVEEVLPLSGTFGEFAMATDARATAAWCLYRLGEIARAEEAIREAILRRPDWVYLHTGLGWILLAQGKHEQAEPEFALTLAANPHYPGAISGMAEVRRRRYADYDAGWDAFYRGAIAEARGLFERILAEQPPGLPAADLCRVRVGLADVAVAEERPADAQRLLQEALSVEPGNALVRERLARSS